MPDHDTELPLNRQTKRRRVDIGVKRTVSSFGTFTQTSAVITREAESPVMSSHHSREEDDVSQASPLGHGEFRGAKSNVLRKLLNRTSTYEAYENAMGPFPSASIIRKILKRSMSKTEVNGGEQCGTEFKEPQEDTFSNSSQDSPQESLSPYGQTTTGHFESERRNDEHLRAKRARVENIIRGMSHSPNVIEPSLTGEEAQSPQQSSSPRENKRKQKLPQQQHRSFQQMVSARKEQKVEERRQLKLQLEDMQKQLRQLQEKFLQMYDSTDSEQEGGHISEDSVQSNDGYEEIADVVLPVEEKTRLKGKDLSSIQEEDKHLAETLKQELNSAMSQVVETVVKVFSRPLRPLLQVFPSLPTTEEWGNGDGPNLHGACRSLQHLSEVVVPGTLESFGGIPHPSSNNQTEALSLVMRKSPSEHHQSSALGAYGGHPRPSLHPSNLGFSAPSFRHSFPLNLMGYSFQSALGTPSGGYSSKDQRSPDSLDLSRESMQSKMASGHQRSCSPVHPGCAAEGLSLSLIKSECGEQQDVSDISLYTGSTIQEGLSPNHLKKAKLMFFYTRYPSSNMLKIYFSDVKFNRCITSQLIKWFSNFREFYYIQMEKFARQAMNDGVLTADDLNVTSDSELYRVLNMHYNKANEFQVPKHFLEVAQITLREFFSAIVCGKDMDPSWKKAIYKVICKLDSDVPEIFKSKNCLQNLIQE